MIFFSTGFHGLWIRIFVPTGLSRFPGTPSLFEFAKYIYCQAAFFFNSCRLIAKSSWQLLVTGAVLLSQNWPCTSLGVPFAGWPRVTLKNSTSSTTSLPPANHSAQLKKIQKRWAAFFFFFSFLFEPQTLFRKGSPEDTFALSLLLVYWLGRGQAQYQPEPPRCCLPLIPACTYNCPLIST